MQNVSDHSDENARLRDDLLTISSRISHDLRSPLGSIIANAQLLQETLAEKGLPITPAQSILDSVDDLTRLIKQASSIARATARPLPKKTVSMKDSVTMALERLENRILKKNATITQPDSWPQINGVASWLEEVWCNLLANALQHSISDRPRIELSWQEEKDGHRFEVRDHGGGVPEEIRPGLFRPFNTLHEHYGVRGLGLVIVQRLIELQGGSCGYEPTPEGSSFYFILPPN